MPWTNQSGGGGGPWKPTPGPWGQGPGGPTGGGPSPDLEDLIRRGQERLRAFMPGGGGLGGLGILALVLGGALLWLVSGFYTVAPNEVGINTIFGRYTGKTPAGWHYNLPYPIGTVEKLPVTDRNSIDIGATVRENPRQPGVQTSTDMPEESLMLTGDDNIADVKFRIVWQIDPDHPEYFAFNLRNPTDTVKAVAESAMREVIGRSQIQNILTSGRKTIEPEVKDLCQKVLNSYNAGVQVVQVQLLSVDPPSQVIAAFRDVTAAQQDLQRMRNEAEAYANKVVPEARGAAAGIVQEAEGYKQQVVQEAQGQASRFDQIYAQYKNAPEITRKRMYLETMESVLAGADKTVLDDKAQGSGVLPLLPLAPGLGGGTPASHGAAKP
ncbi:MAG: FtsH protease activity modulator HflK [Parafilimonas terrae]|nr:FtsH protease activity modulator HflK [Parafilimonas terrae]